MHIDNAWCKQWRAAYTRFIPASAGNRGDLAEIRDARRPDRLHLLRVSEASALDIGGISFASDGGLPVPVRRCTTD